MEPRNYLSGASTSAPTAPGSPSYGYPINGNPATGQVATQAGAYWFYKIAEELRAVIVAGGQTPSDLSLNQLLLAIQSIIANNVNSYPDIGKISAFAGAVSSEYIQLTPNAITVSRATYAALFSVVGTTYGNGDGSTTFSLPTIPTGYALVSGALGSTTVGQIISHAHSYSKSNYSNVFMQASNNGYGGIDGGTVNTGNTGGSANLAAGLNVNWGIKWK